MKSQTVLTWLTCAIALMGCTNSQAQTNARSPELNTSSSLADTQTARTEISKAPTEKTSSYQCKGTNNHLFLGNGTMKNKYGNPIYSLHLCVDGKAQKSFEIVTGRNYTQQRNRNQSGTESPLPNGKYRVSNTLVPGTLVEVGKVDGLNINRPFLAVSPLFKTGRSALGFHVDPSYNKDAKEDGTSGCVGFLSAADFKSFWANVQQYQIKDLQVAINTKASDNPNVAEQR
jgi:L,D-transpeptidase catalytic domain